MKSPILVRDVQPSLQDPDVISPNAAFATRLERFCAAFLQHASSVSAVTRAVLKHGASPRDAVSLYRRAVIALMHRSDFELPDPTCALSANVAWLLRDVAMLSHREIAEVLQTSVPDVQARIDSLRESVLSWEW